ncbi:MAG: two component transcriptional regulator [Candidatus Taylorbacteria bacterium]|nr:two component transcriptional regulator [Candidatus Taylorbacteria bacterium]
MRILVIEDNQKLAESLVRGFTQEGYAADFVLNGEEGEKRIMISEKDYDMVILDISLPGKNGIEICRSFRSQGIMIPIIMLTARDTVKDKMLGLDSGADDYVIKPFSLGELLSRVRALSRRPRNSLPPIIEVGDLILNPANQEVFRGKKKIELTLKEFRILEFFMTKPNEVVTRQQITDHLWDFDFNPFSRAMDVHINNLRNKIGNKNETKLETVRGVGYLLKA